MKAGEALVRLLQDYGVDTVFGIPGTHSLELYRGLSRSSIRHVLPRHEQGAGFMADGYARASGKPGVCFVITGPGVTNIATPLGEAYMDSVPMLVISPVNPPDPGRANVGRLHEITDQSQVTAPLTAFSAIAREAGEIPGLIARAFSVYSSQQPRPVHISISLPALREEIDAPWRAVALPVRPTATPAELDRCAAALDGAERPVIVAGGGAQAAATGVLSLAEKLSCPVITTVAGRGIVPAEHPLCPGAQLRSVPVQKLLAEADVALLVGTELAQTDHFNTEWLELPAQQIRVNLDPLALQASAQTIALLADVGAVVDDLLERCAPAQKVRRDRALRRCEDCRHAVPETFDALISKHMSVLQRLQAALPDDALVVSDMTQLAYTAVEYLPMPQHGRWLHPAGYGTLGYALPAAIGAKLAAPARKVVVVVGDAGLQYTMQELTLAAELGLDLVLVLWNNDALQQIRDDMEAAGIEAIGVRQRNPDFIALAAACGWRAAESNTVEAFAAEMRQALARDDSSTLIKLNENNLPNNR
jgi:5-guanidino-2-oxopentanoate decarboxylase